MNNLRTSKIRQPEILVIDDQASMRFLLGSFFKGGYTVIGIEDGLAAMQWLMKPNFPDLIILDLGVPRLSGMDFLNQIKQSGYFSKIPVIIVSGDESEATISECKTLGAEEYLTKPFDPVKLRASVNKVLDVQYTSEQLDEMQAKNTNPLRRILARARK